jgi:hypothetical protein
MTRPGPRPMSPQRKRLRTDEEVRRRLEHEAGNDEP